MNVDFHSSMLTVILPFLLLSPQIPAAQGVVPSGWYMLFVMNGKVYSTSAWVKISR